MIHCTCSDPLPPPPPARNPSGRPRSALQKVICYAIAGSLALIHFICLQSLDETINPTLVPAVEKWLETANEKGLLKKRLTFYNGVHACLQQRNSGLVDVKFCQLHVLFYEITCSYLRD